MDEEGRSRKKENTEDEDTTHGDVKIFKIQKTRLITLGSNPIHLFAVIAAAS